MHKIELIEKIANATKFPKSNTSIIVNKLFETIADTLRNGQNVTILGFGTFKVARLKAKKGRDLKTGEIIKIPARKAPKFKASSNLKGLVMAKKK